MNAARIKQCFRFTLLLFVEVVKCNESIFNATISSCSFNSLPNDKLWVFTRDFISFLEHFLMNSNGGLKSSEYVQQHSYPFLKC